MILVTVVMVILSTIGPLAILRQLVMVIMMIVTIEVIGGMATMRTTASMIQIELIW